VEKYLTKKVIVGIFAILLGLGITFGDKARMKHYLNKFTSLISDYTSNEAEE
jgi:hypothetical protein